ncbi:hypothetical protein [Pusillimonas sp. ANT_WB101]|uniref:hypothetical protein n=1 Tax=Pusillimonas sp. ANT_WB101 TaxID=2597356 RepID=UPI0011EC1226|nr:hypothetical protein [Pusillimonas sp. ANT_WB101]KAA0911714.1 hypothetical protein FQ179_07915 [Pusillimonas sp. ANT_WB101]
MRRFIVIFLLILLPIQVLAESLEDLRTGPHPISLVEAINVASTTTDAVLLRSTSLSDESNPQQVVHADISDSVSSATLYAHSTLSAERWPDYRPLAFPLVYLPVIKPPRI